MVRVPLLTAAILGFATFHHAIGSSAFAGDEAVVIRRLTRALQACIYATAVIAEGVMKLNCCCGAGREPRAVKAR